MSENSEPVTLHVRREPPIMVVTIDRPEVRNAVDRPTAAALADAFRAFEQDDELSVAVLTGAGGTFCAGADLKAVATGRGNRVTEDGDGPMGPTRMKSTKPVIAAVEGHAVAGGLELAVWCDLRVAADDAVFGVYCRRWGVPLIDGGTVRLPRLVRSEPCARPDPHRPWRVGRRGSDDGPREPSGRARPCARRGDRAGSSDRGIPARAACDPIARRLTLSGTCRSRTP